MTTFDERIKVHRETYYDNEEGMKGASFSEGAYFAYNLLNPQLAEMQKRVNELEGALKELRVYYPHKCVESNIIDNALKPPTK